MLRISNPQSIKRLGHFFTPDFKSGGTPSGRLEGDAIRIPALGGIAPTARSSFRLKSVSNPRKAVKVPFILRNPMNNDTPSFLFFIYPF